MPILLAWKQEAKVLLHARGRWLRLAGYGILAVFLLMLPFALSINVVNVLSCAPFWTDSIFLNTALPYVLMVPTFLLITCPMTVILLRGVFAVVEDVPFLPRAARSYGRDLLLGLLILLQLLLPLVLALIAWMLPSTWVASYFDSPLGNFLGLAVGLVAALAVGALAIPWFALTRGMFFVPYFAAKGYTLRETFRCSRMLVRSNPRLPTQFILSFLVLLALSVLSIGVLLIFYTLPLIWTTYGIAAAASISTNKEFPSGNE